MAEKEVQEIIDFLKELLDDVTVPKNVKTKVSNTMKILMEENTERSIRVDKAISELDDISDDANMQPYTRTQIWNVVSLLEKLSA